MMAGEVIDLHVKKENETTQDNSLSVLMNKIVHVFQNKKMGAFWITLVVLSTTAWTIWNIRHFQTSMTYNNILINQQLSLEKNITELNDKISLIENINTEEHSNYANSRVFNNYQNVAEWLYLLTKSSSQNGLKIEYKMSEPVQSSSINNFLNVPIEIEVLALQMQNISVAYNLFLSFLRSFFNQDWFIQLNHAAIENIGSDSAKLNLLIEVRMWDNQNNIISALK